ncbi:MAG: DUF2207 domain-containing protein [Clostridia bacterium]|nr:DUF2207 domain-containing protein [Clostridia bacterium]
MKRGWAAVAVALFALISLCFPCFLKTERASASSGAPCEVLYYNVDAVVNRDRTVFFEEEISFTMNVTKNSFYRSLPKEGDRFFSITAESPGNEEFSFSVDDNPEVDGFLDINCYGGLTAGKTLVYRFTYTMQVAGEKGDGMIVDFIGAGWPFALNNVTVNVTFPSAVEAYTVYSGSFGVAENRYVQATLLDGGKQMTLTAETLPLLSSPYGEWVAAAITVDFTLPKGTLAPYLSTRIFTPTLWVSLVFGVLFLAAGGALLFWQRKKPIVTPIVNFRPPKGMDPLRMGKFIDGAVDSEDVTSMIYYFASKGWLTISMNGKEPVLHRRAFDLPSGTPTYQRTLFNGLFLTGERVELSDLKEKYYKSVETAQSQLSVKDIPRYQSKSVLCTVLIAVCAALPCLLVPFLTSLIYVGGGYGYLTGVAMALPIALVCVFGVIKDRRKHKGGKGVTICLNIFSFLVMVVGAIVYLFAIGTHVMTEVEKLFVLVVAYVLVWLSPKALTDTENYNATLGEVLGFKEFITVTEKDRIEFLLKDNPELFYELLPYAQVLGVTDAWEEKFKDVLLTPPSWYIGGGSVYDYWLFSRCMRHASFTMMMRPQESGSRVGRSGGGGSFGGFSGGGHGGGGGGFR